MHSIIAQWVHNEPVLCVDEAYERMEWLICPSGWEIMTAKLTLFIPNALGCPMPATPPRQTLDLLSLSWWKREVEEMIKRLRGSGFGDALWSRCVRRGICASGGRHNRCGVSFLPEREEGQENHHWDGVNGRGQA